MGSVRHNESLDGIGKKLVVRGSVCETELDAIVGNEDLFAGVMKRVESAEKVEVRRFSLGMGAAYASVSLVVAVVATATIFTLMRTSDVSSAQTTAALNVPATQPDAVVPPPVRPPQDETQVPTKLTTSGGDQRMIMADSRTYSPAPKRVVPRPSQQPAINDDGEFYPISYGGNDTLAGGRIVRVNLPRAQAFAMGIRVPLENDSDTVNADVIVGPDGVPRAVRLVK